MECKVVTGTYSKGQLFLRTAGERGSREVREGEGLEGEQEMREKVHLPSQLCCWAQSLCWVSPQKQVRRCRLEDAANIPSLDAMWCINKQALRAWQDCLFYLILSRPSSVLLKIFSFLYIFKYTKPQWMQAFPLGSLSQVACLSCQEVLHRLKWQPHGWVFWAEKEEGWAQLYRGFLLKLIDSLAHLLTQNFS